MLSSIPELDGFTVIIAGQLNPAIFHPSWMVSRNLISAAEEELIAIQMVSPDIAAMTFKLTSDDPAGLRLVVEPEKLTLSTDDVLQLPKALDLLKNLLQVLHHTPISAISTIRHQHYRIDTLEEWHRFGHRLAPKEGLWDEEMSSPGLRTLRIESPVEDLGATLVVTVEPSQKIQVGQGVYLSAHLLFMISDTPAQEPFSTAQRAAEKLVAGWDYAHMITQRFAQKFSSIGSHEI